MTVESIISKAIAEEVEKVFSREKVEEIFNEKVKRQLSKAVKKQLENKDLLRELIFDYFDTYHAKSIITNCLVKHLEVSMKKED